MMLIVTLYNDTYSFSHRIDIKQEWQTEEDYLDVVNWFKNSREFDVPLNNLPTDHPVYGWIGSYAQGDYALDINWTHIRYTKKGLL